MKTEKLKTRKKAIVYLLLAISPIIAVVIVRLCLKLQVYDCVFIGLFVLMIAVTAIACLQCRKEYAQTTPITQRENEHKLYVEACQTLNDWQITSTCWQVSEYGAVVFSLLATVLVIYIEAVTRTDAGRVIIYSFLSFAFMIYQYAINPKAQLAHYRQAFTRLKTVIQQYEIGEADIGALIDAIHAGEDEISKCIGR